jgi:hypothetical protein
MISTIAAILLLFVMALCFLLIPYVLWLIWW